MVANWSVSVHHGQSRKCGTQPTRRTRAKRTRTPESGPRQSHAANRSTRFLAREGVRRVAPEARAGTTGLFSIRRRLQWSRSREHEHVKKPQVVWERAAARPGGKPEPLSHPEPRKLKSRRLIDLIGSRPRSASQLAERPLKSYCPPWPASARCISACSSATKFAAGNARARGAP